MNHIPIFNPISLNKCVDKYIMNLIPQIGEKLSLIEQWNLGIHDKSIFSFTEKSLQGTFLNSFFDKILGYSSLPFKGEFNLIAEQSTKIDATKPDAVLGYFSPTEMDVRVVVELKDANCNLDEKQRRINDNRTPIEQAFGYAPKYGSSCKWVIVSNFIEIRLYLASNMLSYEKFEIKSLTNPNEFLKFYYILNRDNLISKTAESLVDRLYLINSEEEQKITKDFYITFKNIRTNLIKDILQRNANIDPAVVIEKAQKLLDRIIFICFCKDSSKELLPHDILNKAFEPFLNSLWENLKLLFRAIDLGNSNLNIHKFNGGLFKEDPELDNLDIPDSSLRMLSEIINFNYSTELNIDILGRIFEQGISDIENLKVVYCKNTYKSTKNMRKQEAIYYTPEHVTSYMVNQAIGKWLEDKRVQYGYYDLPNLSESEKSVALNLLSRNYKYHKKETENDIIVRKYKKHLEFWENFRRSLLDIKVIDISCGSGAFLNQAFSYLLNEAVKVNAELNNLHNGQEKYFSIGSELYQELDKNILQNNIFGVDLNKESIEITRLSLWLSTANKQKPLAPLDENIICRDSILFDETNSLESNFSWNSKFGDVMKNGGFDIVLGNPPYIDSEEMTKSMPQVREFCRKNYESAKGNWDMYIPFIEKGLKILKTNGIICYIIPNKITGSTYSQQMRRILSQYSILSFRDYSEIKVFDDADVYPVVLSLQKNRKRNPVTIQLFNKVNNKWLDVIIKNKIFYRDINWSRYFVEDTRIINIIDKMLEHRQLGKIAAVREASTVSEAYELKNYISELQSPPLASNNYKKLINTGTIDPYRSLWGAKPTQYIKTSYKYPVVLDEDLLKLSSLRSEQANSEKIIIGGMSRTLEAYYDTGEYLAGKSTSIIYKSEVDLKFILALLNSKLISFFYRYYFKSATLSGGYFNIGSNQLKEIPIAINESLRKSIINEVDMLRSLTPGTHEVEMSQLRIDRLIYSLYDLDLDEIYVVNSSIAIEQRSRKK
jgi:tRNA1(Val) A37 N6-methylase TrmN6